MSETKYETVIGLEVHTELATKTKLFSASPNKFGSEPNTHIDPTCLGLPGSLPVLNRRVVELAVRVGLALGSTISPCSFARKNYFYPDMPKDFQISQYELPLNLGGSLDLPGGKKIRVNRAHIEEDTGKIVHIGGGGRIHDADYCLIDYNRAGVPLLEIVSEPDISSAEEAREYVTELRALLIALGASDGKMEEGSLRVDSNVSVRPANSKKLGTRCEIKNVNSLRSLVKAIEYEADRQVNLLKDGGQVKQETRHWDEVAEKTHPLRSKEGEIDYRYFPEPDLVPLELDESWIDEIKTNMPPLPAQRRQKLQSVSGGSDSAVALMVERGIDDFILEVIEKGADSSSVLKLAEQNLADGSGQMSSEAFFDVVSMLSAGELSATQTKTVLTEVIQSGKDPKSVAADLGFEAMDTGDLKEIVTSIVKDNPDEWNRYKEGEEKLEGFFVGRVMKATKGQADGKAVSQILSDLKT